MPELHLATLVQAVLDGLGETAWTVAERDVWCHVEPPQAVRRVQGWKLHLSATRLSAPEVVHRAAGVLVPRGCAFKVARTLSLVTEMTSHSYDRAQCGKIVAVYPRDDEQARELAAELDRVTAGLPGPAILSDRPYRPGSLVHYRFGAFTGVRELSNDGGFEARLRAPDGTLVPDARNPWFSPPAWAGSLFEEAAAHRKESAAGARPGPVHLGGRYVVREAIRHSARGGVYRAVDEETGTTVVIKQARAGVGCGHPAQDARDRLRAEARSLEALRGIAAEPIEVFERDGHAFLVESLIPGEPLTKWVHTWHARGPEGVPREQLLAVARQLAALLEEIHDRGLVYQDFTPNNIMIGPDGSLRLIDAEFAAVPGAVTVRPYTPGFAAPEQEHGDRIGPAHGPACDLYSLGAILCYLVTGFAPVWCSDGSDTRPTEERAGMILSAAGPRNPNARLLAPAILGLMAQDPARRWPIGRVGEFLAAVASAAPADPSAGPAVPAVAGGAWDAAARRRLVDDGLAHLLETMAGDDGAERLWPTTAFGNTTDPCNVHHGAAGVLSVLVRADALLGREELRGAVERAARWIDARRTAVPRLLPGLYFGRAGTAWALFDAARHLGDEALAERAAGLALALPVRWPNPDVCHGAAGSGFAQLHLWRATGREEFRARAGECAGALLAAAEHTADRVLWPVPADFDSALAGSRHFGFAHGVAGVAAFLLAMWRETGDPACLDMAVRAGDTLVEEAERGPWGARWRYDVKAEPGSGLLYHWCSGSSGAGTFLLRLWQATGEARYLALAEEAAVAVREMQWVSPSSVCHGLAGNGEFLLDLADARGGPYRDWAEELAACLHARHSVVGGRRVLPDESGMRVTSDYHVGLGGVVGFLLRLGHGGPRPWMAEDAGRAEGTGRAGDTGRAAQAAPAAGAR
jgi:tRNA A-37 threonylcarbamoyl transferase component Bud32